MKITAFTAFALAALAALAGTEEYCDCEKEGECADPRTEGMCGCAEAIACCSD